MTDGLLFLHVLSAAAMFAALAAFTAVALGAFVDAGAMRISVALWHAGLVGVFVFGLALAFDIDGYHPWDGWVLIAIVLWLGAGYTGDKLAAEHRRSGGDVPADVIRLHWVTVVLVLVLLADMIWKPWA